MEDHSLPADVSKCHVPYAENENIRHSWTLLALFLSSFFSSPNPAFRHGNPYKWTVKLTIELRNSFWSFSHLTAKAAHLLMFLNVPMRSYELASNPVSLVSHGIPWGNYLCRQCGCRERELICGGNAQHCREKLQAQRTERLVNTPNGLVYSLEMKKKEKMARTDSLEVELIIGLCLSLVTNASGEMEKKKTPH